VLSFRVFAAAHEDTGTVTPGSPEEYWHLQTMFMAHKKRIRLKMGIHFLLYLEIPIDKAKSPQSLR